MRVFENTGVMYTVCDPAWVRVPVGGSQYIAYCIEPHNAKKLGTVRSILGALYSDGAVPSSYDVCPLCLLSTVQQAYARHKVKEVQTLLVCAPRVVSRRVINLARSDSADKIGRM